MTGLEISDKDDKAIHGVVKRVANLSHIKRLAEAMAPDPTAWRYDPERFPPTQAKGPILAACTCGHPIINVFTIFRENPPKSLPIGSVCIETTVPYLIEHGAGTLAEALKKAVEDWEEARKEAERKRKDAEADAEVQKVLADAESVQTWLREQAEAYKAQNGHRAMIPYVWYRGLRLKAMITPGRTLNSVIRKMVAGYLDAWNWEIEKTNPPIPTSARLQAAIEKECKEQIEHFLSSAAACSDPNYYNQKIERLQALLKHLDMVA